MSKYTAENLEKTGACDTEVSRFKRAFPKGATFTRENWDKAVRIFRYQALDYVEGVLTARALREGLPRHDYNYTNGTCPGCDFEGLPLKKRADVYWKMLSKRANRRSAWR